MEDLEYRFAHHPPSSDRVATHHMLVRRDCLKVANSWNEHLPEGREKSLAITKLEEAMMWANAAIARNQGGTPSG